MKQPPMPSSVYWLGDREDAERTRHSLDMRGCVLYFDRQSDCLAFMRWLSAHPPLAGIKVKAWMGMQTEGEG